MGDRPTSHRGWWVLDLYLIGNLVAVLCRIMRARQQIDPMTSRTAAIAFRLFFAALSLFAVGAQLFTVHLPSGYDAVNFFSYFTNSSNIFISVVFIISAVRLIRGQTESTAMDAAIRREDRPRGVMWRG